MVVTVVGYGVAQDTAAINAMLCQLGESRRRANEAIDSALTWIETSNQRIAEMERAAS